MQFDTSALLFSLKKIVAALVLPPLAPLLLIVLGLVLLLLRRPRTGHTLAWLGVAATVFFSSGYTVNWLARTLEPPTPISTEELARVQAIVILAGGRRHYAPEYEGGETVNSRTLERMRYGALLARHSGLPVLVSGGMPTGQRPEATLMSEVMAQEFGVPVRWAEGESRDTRENARLAAEDLRAAGITRIALVTHAAHMRRASAEFGAQGLEVIPAPTAWLANDEPPDFGINVLPNAASANAGWFVWHEWVGNLAYSLSRSKAADSDDPALTAPAAGR